MSGDDWPIIRHRGAAADFHGRELPDPVRPELWWFELTRPAVVLGSTQRESVLSAAAAERVGIEVARRRSGGGAVLLVPGDTTWLDVILPVGDPRWRDDVGASFLWLGEAWAAVLRDLRVDDPVVHRGPSVRSRWSDLVCFAGLGSGEVVMGGRKVVGISQRRTRAGARFQCAVVHRWDPSLLVEVLALTTEERADAAVELATAAAGIGEVDPADLVARFRDVVIASSD